MVLRSLGSHNVAQYTTVINNGIYGTSCKLNARIHENSNSDDVEQQRRNKRKVAGNITYVQSCACQINVRRCTIRNVLRN